MSRFCWHHVQWPWELADGNEMSYFSDLHELTGFRDVTSVNILNFRTKIYPLSSKITRNGVGFNISVGIWKSAEKVVKLYALSLIIKSIQFIFYRQQWSIHGRKEDRMDNGMERAE